MSHQQDDAYPSDDPAFELHYKFAHDWVPSEAAESGLAFLEDLLGPRGANVLRAGWAHAARSMGFIELPARPGETLVPQRMQGGGVWYALPEPRFVTGVYFQALLPGTDGLEIYQAERSVGATTLLCGWSRQTDGNCHRQYEVLPRATPEAFLEAVSRVRNRGWGRG